MVDFSGQVARGLAELLIVEAEGLVHVKLGSQVVEHSPWNCRLAFSLTMMNQ